jgi:hypothetical protein
VFIGFQTLLALKNGIIQAQNRHSRQITSQHAPPHRHANALTWRRVRVYGFADVYAICTQLDGLHYLADHVACVQKRQRVFLGCLSVTLTKARMHNDFLTST